MNTLKTITTALLLLFTVTAFSQTKEETLEWLKQHGDNYASASHWYNKNEGTRWGQSLKFYPDYIEVEYWRYDEFGSSRESDYTKLHYKDIYFVENISKLDEYIYKQNENFPGYGRVSVRSKNTAMGFHFSTDQPNARKNLEKVLRAIMHMAKLHGAEPYKDLFGE